MFKNPDMVIYSKEGLEVIQPDWYKVLIMEGKEPGIIKHECLYEGKAAYQKLYNNVILAQITVNGLRKKDEVFKNIENTPTGTESNYLQSREQLLVSNKLWRYLDLYKFEDLIKSQTLYFARLDQFKDNLEGVSPFSCIKAILDDNEKNDEQKKESVRLYKKRMENNRKVGFACCWHMNNNLNFDMWNEYGKDSTESICIETSVKNLNNTLSKSNLPFLEEPVQYFDEPYFNQNAYWFPTLFKRAEYSHEQEFRSILFVHGNELKFIKIEIRPEQLIRKIYIHPKASKEFFKHIRKFIKNNGLKIPISQVRL